MMQIGWLANQLYFIFIVDYKSKLLKNSSGLTH